MIIRASLVVTVLIAHLAAANSEISIALEDTDNSPFEVVLPNKELSGFHVEMVNAVAESINKKVKWVPLPWTRAIDSANRGSVDAITYISENRERSRHLIFLNGNELHSDSVCVFIRKDFNKNKYNGKLESLFGEKVGIAKDYFLTKEIDEKKGNFDLIEVSAVGAQLYEMLSAGRIDYAFGSQYRLKRIIQKEKLKNIVPSGECRYGEKRFIAFSKVKKDADKNAKAFEDAMVKWKKTPAFKTLKEKYEI